MNIVLTKRNDNMDLSVRAHAMSGFDQSWVQQVNDPHPSKTTALPVLAKIVQCGCITELDHVLRRPSERLVAAGLSKVNLRSRICPDFLFVEFR
jgi:hypothetical protein